MNNGRLAIYFTWIILSILSQFKAALIHIVAQITICNVKGVCSEPTENNCTTRRSHPQFYNTFLTPFSSIVFGLSPGVLTSDTLSTSQFFQWFK